MKLSSTLRCFVLVALGLFTNSGFASWQNQIASKSAIVMDSHGGVIFSKNDSVVRPIASITKLMTVLVVLESGQDLDEMIRVSPSSIDKLKGTHSRLLTGTTMTRAQFMKLALMSSENRAATTLCENYFGGIDDCVRAMNRKARDLLMTSTVFVDPSGLNPKNVSSVRDLATLIMYAGNNEYIKRFSTSHSEFVDVGGNELLFKTTNLLVKKPSWTVVAQKTGYIAESGFCLLLRTVISGSDTLMVFLGAPTKSSRFKDAEITKRYLEHP